MNLSVNALDPSRLPGLLKTHWRWPVGAAAALAALTVLVYQLMAPLYRATAAVMLDSRGVERLLDTQRDANPPPASLVSTDMDVIRSEAVLRRSLQGLLLEDGPADLDARQRHAVQAWRDERRATWDKETRGTQPFEIWLLRWLARQMLVQRAAPDSGVVSIQIDHPDPVLSTLLANALAQAYLHVALELSLAPTRQAAAYFDGQVHTAREQLGKAQSARSAFQLEHGILSLSEGADVDGALLAGLAGAAVQTGSQGLEAAARSAQGSLRPEESPEALRAASVQQLEAELARRRAALVELQSRLGEAHPQVQSQRDQIQALDRARAAEVQRVAASLQSASRSAQGAEQAQRALLERQRDRLLGQKHLREQLAVLQQDVDAARSRYEQAQQRLAQSTGRNESMLSNARLLAEASLPLSPTRPPLLMAVVFAVLTGLLVGGGGAVLSEQRQPRLRLDEDITAALGLTLLASLPPQTALARSGAEPWARQLAQRLGRSKA